MFKAFAFNVLSGLNNAIKLRRVTGIDIGAQSAITLLLIHQTKLVNELRRKYDI